MPEHSSKRPQTRQVRGDSLVSGAGVQQGLFHHPSGVEALSRQQSTERKSPTLGLSTLAIQTTQ
jgi:hypothetical protein